jgi:hypothetical protein
MSSIDRKPHKLKRQKSMTIPRHFIMFDTETTPTIDDKGNTKQTFKLGWLCYYKTAYSGHKESETWIFLPDIQTFWDFIQTLNTGKDKIWIIARNINFDFTIVKGWDNLNRLGYKLKFFHNNGVSCIITVKGKKNSLAFIDSMNWFPESLAATGERLGIPKMKIDFDTCTYEELSTYCKNDVRIEVENIKEFIRFLTDNLICKMCYTRASTAMAAYLFRHYNHDIFIHNNKEVIDLERESYKGGRCECHYIGDLGEGKYYTLDVNSLYPYCMSVNKYPTKYIHLIHKPNIKELIEAIDKYSIVAKLRIKTNEPAYALKTERTIFPIGEFDVTLCTPEIKYAIDNNHIIDIHDMVLYEQDDIFSSYVKYFYELRVKYKSANKDTYQTLCKYLLNSLYGKFGQKAEDWELIGKAENEPDREEFLYDTETKRMRRIRYLLNQLFELKRYGESYNSFPAISSHVTAYGRMHLYNLMKICGVGNYYYCDTDSLMVNEQGYNNLLPYINSKELGKLKLEETFGRLILYGLKDYTTDTKTALKGIRKNAKQIDETTYKQECWPSIKGLLHSEDCNTYIVKPMTKHLSRKYTKGNVQTNGQVKPFVLS